MATPWIELDTPMDPSSRVNYVTRLITHALGDGYQYRQKDGINNMSRVFTVQYKNMSPAENAQMVAFLRQYGSSGEAMVVPLLPEDHTGATTALFYIQSFDGGADDGGMVYNWTIQLQEVFGE